MTKGDLVKYSNPIDGEEAAFIFVIIEHRGDRAVIELFKDPAPLPGQELVAIEDISSL